MLLAVLPGVAGATPPGANGSIAFQRHVNGSVDVMVMAPNGALQRTIMSDADNPAWSASGTRVAVGARSAAGNGEIFTMAGDGSDRRQITTLGQSADFPAWSPDDAKIAFAAYSTTSGYWDVWVVESDGENPSNVTAHAAEDIMPTWSPDGTKLAFQSNRDGNREIYVIDAAGGVATNLTQRPISEEEYPDWSPDGTKLVFSSYRVNVGSDIYVISADGTGLQQLTHAGGATMPTWSPDGQRIAFTSSAPGSEIATMRADGTQVRVLTDNSDSDLMPSWQPVAAGNLTTTTLVPSAASIIYGEDVVFETVVTSTGPTPSGVVQLHVDGIDEGAPRAARRLPAR